MLPLGSISALINPPHCPPFMLLGSVGQPSTSRYELGSWVCLGYWLCWVCAATPNMAIAESTAMKVAVVRSEGIIIANTSSALAAHVAERASSSAVADVLELDFDAVGGVNPNLGGRALSQPR